MNLHSKNRMMIKKLFVVGSLLIFLSCNESKQLQSYSKNQASADSSLGLKDYYKDFFMMGVAVSPRALKGEEANLIVKHFNSITPENAMKMGLFIHRKMNTTGEMQIRLLLLHSAIN